MSGYMPTGMGSAYMGALYESHGTHFSARVPDRRPYGAEATKSLFFTDQMSAQTQSAYATSQSNPGYNYASNLVFGNKSMTPKKILNAFIDSPLNHGERRPLPTGTIGQYKGRDEIDATTGRSR
jgi:hypothetical protein